MLRSILFVLFCSILVGSSLEDEEISFDTIWSLTCEVSSFVSRSKRSIELPDIFNAKETFDYLFPLANVKPEEFAAGGGRSNSAPGISMWWDDIVDLWHHECGQRRSSKVKRRRPKKGSKKSKRKGRANPNNESNRMNPDDVITWAGYLGNISSTYNKYFPAPLDMGDEEEYGAEEKESKYTSQEEGEEVEVDAAVDHEEEGYDAEYPDDQYDDKYDDSEEEEEHEETTSTSTTEKSKKEEEETTEATTTTTTTTATPETDPYFASYGGDIEYFFPILSFTIPFDGEITLLGFHGFKGMFLY